MTSGASVKFSFTLNTNESAYYENCIKGAHEYEPGKFFVLVNGYEKYFLTQRKGK